MSGETAVERVTTALDRAHGTQNTINAFISIDDQRALARAHELDASDDSHGPLSGVPIAIKDLIDHEGRVTTNGSSFYAEVATQTADCVAGLEKAGAVIIGRTNLHEWAFGFNSENEHWGAVHNPWDLRTSPGGSSGGSGAAVAAGTVPIAIGTDTGGSVRVPAALCGTFGLKVTHRAISLDGVFPLVPSIDTVGPLANSMENIGLAYRAMSGDKRPADPPGTLRLGIPEPWYADAPIDPEIKDVFEATVTRLREMGHEVHPIQMPDVKPSPHLIAAIEEVASVHREFRLQGKQYSKAVEERIIRVEQVTDEEVTAARDWQQMIRSRFTDAFATVDFLITPACAARQKLIGEEMIGDKHHRTVLSYFSAVVNHALLPALALPIANSGAPPASLQVIGPLGSDPELIGLGRSLEEVGLTVFEPATSNSPTPPVG